MCNHTRICQSLYMGWGSVCVRGRKGKRRKKKKDNFCSELKQVERLLCCSPTTSAHFEFLFQNFCRPSNPQPPPPLPPLSLSEPNFCPFSSINRPNYLPSSHFQLSWSLINVSIEVDFLIFPDVPRPPGFAKRTDSHFSWFSVTACVEWDIWPNNSTKFTLKAGEKFP